MIRGERADDQQVNVFGLHARVVDRSRRRFDAQVTGREIVRGVTPGKNAGPLLDPLRIEALPLAQVSVRDDAVRHIRADAGNPHSHQRAGSLRKRPPRERR